MNVRIKSLSPRPMASVRLLCIPFAGAGVTAFRNWGKLLPGFIEAFAVQLPGREDRLGETPYTSWQPMIESAAAAIAALPALPTAVFGHSLGAVIALDLARWMQRSQPGRLRHVFAAGRPWPGGPTLERRDLASVDDDTLLSVLDRQYGSLSSSLVHPEIRELTLPVLRADLQLLDAHRYVPDAPLACPLTVYGGDADPITHAANLEAWRAEAGAAFRVRMLDGAHFFLESHRDELLADIGRSLDQSAR